MDFRKNIWTDRINDMLRKTEVNLMRLSSPYHDEGFNCSVCHQSHEPSARSPTNWGQIERKTNFEELDKKQNLEEARKQIEIKQKFEISRQRDLADDGLDFLRELIEKTVKGLEKDIFENFRKNKLEVQSASDRIGTLEINFSSFELEIRKVVEMIKELEKKVRSRIELGAEAGQYVQSEELAIRIEELKISNSEFLKKVRIDIENIRLKSSENNEEVYREVERISNEHQKKFVSRLEFVKIKESYENINENVLKDMQEKTDDELTKIKKKFENFSKVTQSKFNDHENSLTQVAENLDKKVSDADLNISKFRDSHSQQLKVLKIEIEKLENSLNFDDIERRLSKAETRLKIIPKPPEVDTSIFIQIDEMNSWKIKFDKLMRENKVLEKKIDYLEEKITSIHESKSVVKKYKPKLRVIGVEDPESIFLVKPKRHKKKKLSLESFQISIPKRKKPKLSYESSVFSILKSKIKKPKLTSESSNISVRASRIKRPKLSFKTFSDSIENKKEHNLSTETSSLVVNKRKKHRLSIKKTSSLMIAKPQKPLLSLEVNQISISSQKVFEIYTEKNQISTKNKLNSSLPDNQQIIISSQEVPPSSSEYDSNQISELTIIPKKSQRKNLNDYDSNNPIEIIPNLEHIPTTNMDLLFMDIPESQIDSYNKDSKVDYKNNTFGAEEIKENKILKQNDLFEFDLKPNNQPKQDALIDFKFGFENENIILIEPTESAKFGDLNSKAKENLLFVSNTEDKKSSDDDSNKYKTKDLKLIVKTEQKGTLIEDFQFGSPKVKKLRENSLDGSSVEDLHFPKPAIGKIEKPAKRKQKDVQDKTSDKDSVEDLDFEKPKKTKIEKPVKTKLRDEHNQSPGLGSVEDLNFEKPAKTKLEKPVKRNLRDANEDSSSLGSVEDLNFEKPAKTKIEKPIKRKLREADKKSSDEDSIIDMNFEKPIKTKIEKPDKRKNRAGHLKSSGESSSEDDKSKHDEKAKIQIESLSKPIEKKSDDEDSVIDLNFEKPAKPKIEKPQKRTPRQQKPKSSEDEQKETDISLMTKVQKFFSDFQDKEVEYCCNLADYIKKCRLSRSPNSKSSNSSNSSNSNSSKSIKQKSNQMNHKLLSSSSSSSTSSPNKKNLHPNIRNYHASSSSSSSTSSKKSIQNSELHSSSTSIKHQVVTAQQKKLYLDQSGSNSSSSSSNTSQNSSPNRPQNPNYQFKSSSNSNSNSSPSSSSQAIHKPNSFSIDSSGSSSSSEQESSVVSSSIFNPTNN